jgi:hypothetical protein
MVVCRGMSTDESLFPENLRNAKKQFSDWFDRMVSEGKIQPGHRLAPEGAVLSGKKAITDGPFAESKESIAGYWIIQAGSLEEAVEIAKGDPLLDYGHTVEVRPILPDISEDLDLV